jgi:SpoVK/Ycf46/Vps4 family AAA+-type ATPase
MNNDYNIYLINKNMNNLITHNIKQSEIIKLHLENHKLKFEIENANKYINSLKRELHDKDSNENTNKHQKLNTKIVLPNKYRVIIYKPISISWNDEKINSILSSIHSIDDIINNLNGNYIYFKHNYILTKLNNLIPALIKLKELVGLKEIKKSVFKKIIYFIQNDNNMDYLHTVISGPPGVGKTEFAKIYADIFVRLGILQKDQFMTIKRDDLVGEYLGSTSVKTRKLLDSALGGVLFLDEAYSLGNSERRDTFSKEAIDMINLYLSEKKGEFMFIIAGYEEDIDECFFAFNKGLKRRFHTYYNIESYKPNELKEIFINKIKQLKYNLLVDNEKLEYFFVENKNNFEFFGGSIETLCNEIKQVHAIRTFNKNINNKEIIFEDIKTSLININSNKHQKSDSRLSLYT